MIAHWDEVARDADLAEAAGAVAVSSASVNFGHLEPGHDGASPHCHSADEELFVFFEGGATFERPCHLAAPSTGVSHAFRAGDEGVSFLVYGTRRPNDVLLLPTVE